MSEQLRLGIQEEAQSFRQEIPVASLAETLVPPITTVAASEPQKTRIGIKGAFEFRKRISTLVAIGNKCIPTDLRDNRESLPESPNSENENKIDLSTRVNHTEKDEEHYYSKSWGFLSSTTAREKDVRKYIDKKSEWTYKPRPFPVFKDKSLADLNRRLRLRLGPLIDIGNASLLQADVNDHSVANHVEPVVQDTVALLELAGCSRELQEEGMYAAWGHDLANPFSKSTHSWVGIKLLKRMIPEITSVPERWKRIRRAFQYHDSSISSPLIDQMDAAGMDYEAKIEGVRHYLGEVGAALHIADKIQVFENRVQLDRTRSDHVEFVDKDLHKRVNAQTTTESASLNDDHSAFVWNLKIKPYVDATNFHRLKSLVHPQSRDLRNKKLEMVGSLSDEINNNPKSALQRGANDFRKIYPGRLKEMPLFVFALFPQVNEFQIVFSLETRNGLYKESLVFAVDRSGNVTPSRIRRKPWRQEIFPRGGKIIPFPGTPQQIRKA